MTRTFEVPFLVNTVDLEDGEQLFLEVPEVALKPVPKRDCKHAHHKLDANKKAQAVKDMNHDGDDV